MQKHCRKSQNRLFQTLVRLEKADYKHYINQLSIVSINVCLPFLFLPPVLVLPSCQPVPSAPPPAVRDTHL